MRSVRLKPIVLYIVIAYVLAWLVALPLWLGGQGLGDPLFTVYALVMMLTPTAAALLVTRFAEPKAQRPGGPGIARSLGLWPLKPVGPFLAFLAAGWLLPMLLVVGGLLLGALLGLYPADVTHLPVLRGLMAQQAPQAAREIMSMPTAVLLGTQLVSILVGSIINMVPALAEEIGWRGWLVPRLEPWGKTATVLISGIIWGLWHAPLILLGYNYPGVPGGLSLLAMTGMTISFGAVFAWLRMASGSVWPAALAHGSFNAAAGLYVVFAATSDLDLLVVAPLGWTGWILPLVLAVLLLWKLPVKRARTT
ncbi:MAG: lysostaphin resistance A-like protein [Arthrobacter sp.]|uniref:lysostaphin resistance A-like protein n=2 Tax=Arthrobacter TaxID=1663 RepID=UPI00264F4EB0|nr:CPBP family intramembrane metalloprotease [Micrococcaceae bacterium]MDN5811937.1 CPBP family intramembrane metalloprotease [Micrococcaceae bacterium]MDN5823541.1 CPBP family intramembrane metalloprotease [Micrococcaceae bacterium]MDN5879770.1 CPBP family intramembrane metalloprotease [Micrococcaceae bacterium]MDN5887006.1 CPBP family intramembrane metalloprotease [Micrococcaceae bacterium]